MWSAARTNERSENHSLPGLESHPDTVDSCGKSPQGCIPMQESSLIPCPHTSERLLEFLKEDDFDVSPQFRGETPPLIKQLKNKIKNKKFLKNKQKIYVSQSGSFQFVDKHIFQRSTHQCQDQTDLLLAQVEDLGLFLTALRHCSSMTGALAVILMKLKSYIGSDVSLMILALDFLQSDMEVNRVSILRSLRETAKTLGVEGLWDQYSSQSSEKELEESKNDTTAHDCPQWLLLLRRAKDWTKITKSKSFTKLSKFISMCGSLGLCNLANFQMDYNGVRVFSIGAYQKHVSALDLAECLCETVSHFVEGGYRAFQTGDIRYLLYDDTLSKDFDDNYWELVKLAPHAKNGTLSIAGCNMHTYRTKLDKCLEQCDVLSAAANNSFDKSTMKQYKTALKRWQSELILLQTRGDLRKAPFGVYIWGSSGIGKSTLSQIIMKVILKANGLPCADENLVNLQGDDKFQSNFTSNCNGIFLDDVGNTKTDFLDVSPTQILISLMNNVAHYANKAEVDQKGSCPMLPDSVVANSNLALQRIAEMGSNEIFSIVRRFHFQITGSVKPEFATSDGRLSSRKMREFYKGEIPAIPDCWSLKLFIPDELSKNKQLLAIGEDLSIFQVLDVLIRASKEHYADQESFVVRAKNIETNFDWCSECSRPSDICTCEGAQVESIEYDLSTLRPEPEPEPRRGAFGRGGSRPRQGGRGFGNQFRQYTSHADEVDLVHKLKNAIPTERITTGIEAVREYTSMQTMRMKNTALNECSRRYNALADQYYEWGDTPWSNAILYVPDKIFQTEFFQEKFVAYHMLRDSHHILRYRKFFPYVFLLFQSLILISIPLYVMVLVFFILFVAELRRSYRAHILAEAQEIRYRMPTVLKRVRDIDAKTLIASSVAFATVYSLLRLYRQLRTFSSQGNLMPTSLEEIEERDKEKSVWAQVDSRKRHVSVSSRVTSTDHLLEHAKTSTSHMEVVIGPKKRFCNAFFIRSNVALVPSHVLPEEECPCVFTRYETSKVGSQFRSFLSKKRSVQVPKTDIALVYVPTSGSWKDLTEYLPVDPIKTTEGQMAFRDADGSVRTYSGRLKYNSSISASQAENFAGYEYMLTEKTFNGMCMSPWVGMSRYAELTGFHLGGVEGTGQGCCGVLLKNQFFDALSELEQMPGVMLVTSSSEIPEKEYDLQFFESEELHPKSPVGFLEEGSNLFFYGSVTGRARYYSKVVPTEISDTVTEVTGVPQRWGKPNFCGVKNWRDTLVKLSDPAPGLPFDDLQFAVSDYVQPLTKFLEKHPKIRAEIKPLNEVETVSGIDGVRFIDAMKPNTSRGFPEGGAKNQSLIALDPNDFDNITCPRTVEQKYWDRAEEVKESFRAGKRANCVFKACLKDEPTKLEKEKVRVFQSAPLALQLLIRMYYLPIARFLSTVPILSECAVGINSVGPEWDQLATFIRAHGQDRIIAGDYKSYDTSMSAEASLAAFDILITLAQACGYSADDITIMKGIASEIAYPLVAYNGDLIQLFGSNPSGHNLTVYINCIVNSLYHRCCFHSLLKSGKIVLMKREDFRSVVNLTTYGDDYKGSVNKKASAYNNVSFVAYMNDVGDVIVTNPDKESEIVPYYEDSQVDFLKRHNVWNDDIGAWIGALGPDSMFKCLHSVLESKFVTNREQCCSNIDTFIRESFPWGRKLYERNRDWMRTVAERHNFSHNCMMLDVSYDAYLEKHYEQYYPETTMEEEES